MDILQHALKAAAIVRAAAAIERAFGTRGQRLRRLWVKGLWSGRVPGEERGLGCVQ
jgi:hypothetical protein